MKKLFLAFCALGVTPVYADQPPAGELVLEENFDRKELGKSWNSTTGNWRIEDGVLVGSEIKSENHSAATRRVLLTQDATYEMRFKMFGDASTFHFGFDPARGELKKKGHLFSVIVTPQSWKIMKHVDKNRRKEDPNESLAQAKTAFDKGKWYRMRVVTSDESVVATIEGKEALKASHPTFGVKKPTLVFRCLGDGVQVDDIRVWRRTK